MTRPDITSGRAIVFGDHLREVEPRADPLVGVMIDAALAINSASYVRRIITQDCRYGFRQIVSVCRCTSLIEYHLQLGPSSRKVHHRFAKVFPELTVQPSGTNYHMLATYSHDLLLTPQFCHTIHTGWRTLLILLAGHIVRLFAKHIIRRDLHQQTIGPQAYSLPHVKTRTTTATRRRRPMNSR